MDKLCNFIHKTRRSLTFRKSSLNEKIRLKISKTEPVDKYLNFDKLSDSLGGVYVIVHPLAINSPNKYIYGMQLQLQTESPGAESSSLNLSSPPQTKPNYFTLTPPQYLTTLHIL